MLSTQVAFDSPRGCGQQQFRLFSQGLVAHGLLAGFLVVDLQIYVHFGVVPGLYTFWKPSNVARFPELWVKGLFEVMNEEVLWPVSQFPGQSQLSSLGGQLVCLFFLFKENFYC